MSFCRCQVETRIGKDSYPIVHAQVAMTTDDILKIHVSPLVCSVIADLSPFLSYGRYVPILLPP